MFILQKIREISFKIATLGKIGEWTGGSLVASLLGFPIILISRLTFDFIEPVFWSAVGVLFVLYFFILYFALGFVADKYPSDIVLDRLVGILISFAFVPLKWKLMLIGFIMFQVINFFRPFLFYKLFEEKLERFSFSLKIFTGTIVSGIICNILLQLILWVMD